MTASTSPLWPGPSPSSSPSSWPPPRSPRGNDRGAASTGPTAPGSVAPGSVAPGSVAPGSAASAHPSDPASATTRPATTPSTSVSASATPSSPAAQRQGIGLIKARLNDQQPLSITVLGDDSSVGDTGWVFVWARDTLGTGHTVVYHEYSRSIGGYLGPRTLSTDGPRIDVWNASYASATTPKVAADLGKLYPQPTDVVILNLGHQDDPATIDADTTALWQAVTAKQTPLGLVILQNPETATTGLQDTRMKNLARSADRLGLPTVDVLRAFTDSKVPLTQLVIGARPTDQGVHLWVATLTTALT
ncbi:hypothetical protein [Raineyella fluvialis]|uniref:GDSL-like Lipase/Acylhydrolase family protein n=1 Tax=Raineyella fluvialis TaxID=2662261 RepID=A0A5Q2FCW2_9ACTN|nr:hypothetical protein [Raineyella fluvialis]QGF24221.1 hypothetical protein Rai3103_11685 [Raineyella fluvialis]